MINVGGINITDSVINTEFRLGVLERIVDKLLRVAPPGTLSVSEMESIRAEVLSAMKKKYPEAGITSKP